MTDRQRVAVVTGGGGGIGAALAQELGRSGWFVVTVDPLVALDGSVVTAPAEETTADRVIAAGGSAMASSASVTDRAALVDLFGQLVATHGGIDGVINVAGITRQTGFAHGSADDWRAVLEVHLGGFLNILHAALPHMAAQGRGSVLGVTSGSGWRAANAGAYSCAKRVVASLVWQLGRQLPPGVTINAISPIAATRMVAAAAERARKAGTSGGGGLSLFESMPKPEELAPLGSHLVDDGFRWCTGRVFFAGGSEVAVIDQPRLIEVVRTEADVAVTQILGATVPKAFVPAEARQISEGGSNPRFAALYEPSAPAPPASTGIRACLVVGDGAWAGSVADALEACSVTCHRVAPGHGFPDAGAGWRGIADEHGPLDAIVLVREPEAPPSPAAGPEWEQTLAAHAGMVRWLEDDAAWARAAADHAKETARAVRFVSLIGATHAGGRSRAQAAAQLARSAAESTAHRVCALSVSVEGSEVGTLGQVGAYLATADEASGLAGAELVLGRDWFGLRSHPRPLGSITYGGPDLPYWFDDAIGDMVGPVPVPSAGAS